MSHLTPMRQGEIRPSGWILAQMQRDLDDGFAGCLDALTSHAAHDLFRERIDSSPGQHAWWDAETRGNWLWGYGMTAFLSGHEQHMARATGLIQELARTQDPDGYIGIYTPASRYRHTGENAELWAQSRALLAMLAMYEFTGNQQLLARVRTAADLTMRRYGATRSYFRQAHSIGEPTGITHGLCYVDVAQALYRLTGEQTYRDFGRWLFRDFSATPLPFPNDDLAAPNLRDPHLPLRGHAVHTAEHLRAVLLDDPHALTGAAIEKLKKLTTPSGALVGDEWVHGLPLADAGYEYCTVTELLFSLLRAIEEIGNIALADWAECLAFNAAQGARSADGRGVSYLTSDTRLYAVAERPDSHSLFAGSHGRFKVSPTHEDVACCCNPNAVRLMPHFVNAMWMRTGISGLAAVLYGPCAVNADIGGVRVAIREETAYPFEDRIELEVSPERPVAFALHLRKPAWASAMHVSGADAHEGTIERTWMPGDRLTVRFEASPRFVPYPTGEVAVFHRPLQYVQPIEAVERELKSYAVAGFHDIDLVPAGGLSHVPVLSGASDLSLEEASSFDPRTAWSNPPVRLRVGGTTLLPMGSAQLRRAAFPYVA